MFDTMMDWGATLEDMLTECGGRSRRTGRGERGVRPRFFARAALDHKGSARPVNPLYHTVRKKSISEMYTKI